MIRANLRRSLTLLGLLGLSMNSLAAVPPPEARSFALGGTGVASANALSAPLINPALLSLQTQSTLAIQLPYLGVMGAIDDDMIDSINQVQNRDLITQLDSRLSQYQQLVNDPDPDALNAALDDIINLASDLDQELTTLDRETVQLNARATTVIAAPDPSLGWAFFADTRLHLIGVAHYQDSALLQSYLSTAQALRDQLVPPEALPPLTLESEARLLGWAVAETGIALSRLFDVGLAQPLAIGLAPKAQHIVIFDYIADIDDFDRSQLDAREHEKRATNFNLNAGIATELGPHNAWSLGLTVQDLLRSRITTTTGRTLTVHPTLRAGISYRGTHFRWLADMELIAARPIGQAGNPQLLATGIEYNLTRLLSLRAGLRTRLGQTPEWAASGNALTAGLGLNLAGIQADFAALLGRNEAGLALQMAFHR